MIQSKLLLRYFEIQHYFFDCKESDNLETMGIYNHNSIGVKQVHGKKVCLFNGTAGFMSDGFDSIITQKPVYLKITTADCIPILLYEKNKKIVGIIHAGWKGLYKGIIINTIKKILDIGGQSHHLIAAIGPHIRKCCYNVPYERIIKFRKIIPDSLDYSEFRNTKWFLDLDKIAGWQLTKMGIPEKFIDNLAVCTCCNRNYYSVRRDGVNCPRIYSVIRLI